MATTTQATKPTTDTVSTAELSNFLGIHRRTIQEWVSSGCPVAHRAKLGDRGGHQFVPRDVMNWLKERAVYEATGGNDPELMSAEEAKRRKLTAEAGLQEIELAKKKATVVDIEEMYRAKAEENAELRTNMRNIPSRVAMQCVGETEKEIHRIILEEIDIALRALADD